MVLVMARDEFGLRRRMLTEELERDMVGEQLYEVKKVKTWPAKQIYKQSKAKEKEKEVIIKSS